MPRGFLGRTRSEATTFTYYDVLGVPSTATHDELRDGYRDVALQAHPDRVAASAIDPADAELLMRAVNEAWHVLGDPVSRAAYDADLARQQREGQVSSPSRAPDDENDVDRRHEGEWPAERPTSALGQLVPLLVLVALLVLIAVFTAYAKTG